jgi:hypothetical protein
VGYNSVYFVECQKNFQRNTSPPLAGSKNKPSKIPALSVPLAFVLLSCLVHSSTLKMEVIRSSETSVDFQRRHIPEDFRDWLD